jgi:hypothetical protein
MDLNDGHPLECLAADPVDVLLPHEVRRIPVRPQDRPALPSEPLGHLLSYLDQQGTQLMASFKTFAD